jgi:integrase
MRRSNSQFYCLQLFLLQLFIIFLFWLDTAFDTVQNYSLLNSVPLLFGVNLKKLAEKENMHPFRAARLADRGGDIKKRWYINYYVWDVQRNSLVRKQYYEINNYKTATERYAAARIAVKQINEMLEKGFHIDDAKLEEQKELKNITMIKAIELALEIKKPKIAQSSYRSFNGVVDDTKKYLNNFGGNLAVANWKKSHSIKFLDYLRTDKKLGAASINKYRALLQALFSLLVEREIVENNPWKGIKSEKVVESNANIAFELGQVKTIMDALRKRDPKLLSFVQIMFYTFMRPNELRLTKVKSVDIIERKIFVPAEISKNRKSAFIDIPEQLIPTLTPLLENKAPNEMLFTNKKGKAFPENVMYHSHRRLLIRLNMYNDHTLYSWKHTGVVQAFKNGVNIKSIQLQCRHASISQTDTYLKSLGLVANDGIKFGMPDLPQ